MSRPARLRLPRRPGGGSPRTTEHLRVFVLGALCATSTIILIGAVLLGLTRWVRPSVLDPSAPTTAVAAEATELDDAATVGLELSYGPQRSLTSQLSGRLTASECRPGGTLKSGSELGRIDGASLVALATKTPLHRDLALGDSGTDVTALKETLRTLGHDLGAGAGSDAVDAATLGAVADLLGETTALTTIPVGRLVWIPAETVTVASCPAQVGAQVDSSTELAALTAALTEARLTGLPSTAVDGDRVLTVPGLDEPLVIGTSTTLTDTAVLEALQGTDTSAATTTDGTGSGASAGSGTTLTVEATWALATPLDAISVPPAALYDLAGDKACVQSPDGTALPVTVLASHLGASLVQPEGDHDAPTQVSLQPREDLACR